MKYIFFVLILFCLLFSSCVSTPDSGDNPGPEPKNQDDLKDVILYKDFNSPNVTPGLTITYPENIIDGKLLMNKNGSHLQAHSNTGFKEVIVCYALLTEKGHLYVEVSLLNNNRIQPHFFNYPDSSAASFWDGNEMIEIGKLKGMNAGKWIIHKIKIEADKLNYYADNELIGSRNIIPDEALTHLSIYTALNADGYLGYIIVK